MTDGPAIARRVRYHARWVLPVTGPAIVDGTVVVEGDRIVWVGPRRELSAHDTPDAPVGAAAPSVRDDELGDAILMPGLINTHTHLDLTVMRGLLEGLPFFGWIRALTGARQTITEEEFLDSARLGILEGLRAGVTTFADTAPSRAGFDAMRELGVRGTAYREVFGPDPAQYAASLEALRRAVHEMRIDETPLVRVGVSPHAPYSVSDPLYAAVAAFARQERLPLATHIAESEDESALVTRGTGTFAAFLGGRGIAVTPRARSPIALLEQCGVLGPETLLIHCVRADADDIRAIATHGCGVAHCPASNAKLGHGIAPLLELLAAGVPVGLGSDSMASNNRMDLVAEARLAVLAQRAHTRRDDALGAQAALTLATLGGARALGLGDVIGSLEPGKLADMAVFPVPAELEPVYDPYDALIWAMAGSGAERVVVGGRDYLLDGTAALRERMAVAARVRNTAARLALQQGIATIRL